MSECSGAGCQHCEQGYTEAVSQRVKATPSVAKIEAQIEELYQLRRMAKSATRSGDPAIRAEAKRGVEECNEHLAALRKLLGKEDPSAQL